jgi:hypothetical protein
VQVGVFLDRDLRGCSPCGGADRLTAHAFYEGEGRLEAAPPWLGRFV